MSLLSQNIDDIQTCTNYNIGMKSAYLYFNDFPVVLTFYIYS